MSEKLKYSVTISVENLAENAPVIFRGPFEEQIKLASELGYDAVEIHLRDPEKINAQRVNECCRKYNMAVSAIATGLEYSLNKHTLISESAEKRKIAIDVIKRHIDLGAQIGCMVIVGCVRGNIPEGNNRHMYWRWFDEAILSLSDYAAQKNIDIAIESINYYMNNYLNSVADTVSYLNRLGRKNVKLHIDTHHMNIEDDDMLDAVRLSATHLGYVHFSGANRLYPSAGKLPYEDIQKELRKMKYDGYISLECIPVPDSYTAAKRGIDYLKAI